VLKQLLVVPTTGGLIISCFSILRWVSLFRKRSKWLWRSIEKTKAINRDASVLRGTAVSLHMATLLSTFLGFR